MYHMKHTETLLLLLHKFCSTNDQMLPPTRRLAPQYFEVWSRHRKLIMENLIVNHESHAWSALVYTVY